jgi:hypothetical protein
MAGASSSGKIAPHRMIAEPNREKVDQDKRLGGQDSGWGSSGLCRWKIGHDQVTAQTMVEQGRETGIRARNVIPSIQYWQNWTKVPLAFTSWATDRSAS